MLTYCFPRANERIARTIKANVVVRIPPPDELGDDPTNIKPQNIVSVAVEKAFISTVANPALRVVNELNVA